VDEMRKKPISTGRQIEGFLIKLFGLENDALLNKLSEDLFLSVGTIKNYLRTKPTQQFMIDLQKQYGNDIVALLTSENDQVRMIAKVLAGKLEHLSKVEDLRYVESLLEFSDKFCDFSVRLDIRYILMRVMYNCGKGNVDDVEILLNETEEHGSIDQLVRLVSEVAYINIVEKNKEYLEQLFARYSAENNDYENTVVDKEVLSFYFNERGRFYKLNETYKNARRDYNKSLNLTNDPRRRWKEHTNIAITYWLNGRRNSLKNAIKHHNDAIEAVQDFSDREMIARSYNNIAFTYETMYEYKNAYNAIKLALENIDSSITHGNRLNIYDTLFEISLNRYEVDVELFSQIMSDLKVKHNFHEYKDITVELLEKISEFVVNDRILLTIFVDDLLEINETVDNNVAEAIKSQIGRIFIKYYKKGVLKL